MHPPEVNRGRTTVHVDVRLGERAAADRVPMVGEDPLPVAGQHGVGVLGAVDRPPSALGVVRDDDVAVDERELEVAKAAEAHRTSAREGQLVWAAARIVPARDEHVSADTRDCSAERLEVRLDGLGWCPTGQRSAASRDP